MFGSGKIFKLIESENYEAVKSFLSKKPDHVNKTNRDGETPLHDALRRLNDAIARLLIRNGADVNAPDKSGLRPLHRAKTEHQVAMLIKDGADIDGQDNEGSSALHQAASWGRLNIVKALVDNGANLNLEDKKGETPIHKVIIDARGWDAPSSSGRKSSLPHSSEYSNILEYLLSKGADPNHEDLDGKPPLRKAVSCRNQIQMKLLTDAGANIKDALVKE